MKNAIVTGGAKGIGKAIVEQLAYMGINVILNYNKSEEQAIKTQKELASKGYQIKIFKADLSERSEVKKLIKYAQEIYGSINILINNAGIDQVKMFIDLTDEDWNNMIRNNLNSVFYTTQEALPDMIKNKNGCIINISSIWGIVGGSCETHYSATKAAIDGLTKALSKELAPSNIRVNSIAPGAIMTDMNKNLTQEEINDVEKEIPLGRFGKPIDIAKCVKWLIEDEYTTGQIISPNGGWVIT